MSFLDFLFRKKRPKLDFPKDIESLCHRAMAESRNCIEKTSGKKLKSPKSVRVIKKVGEKKIQGKWCWRDERFETWVGGLASRSTIQIGCSPKGSEIYYPFLKHEFGHIWLLNNFNETGHNIKYRDCFERWMDPVLTKSEVGQKDSEICIDIVEE